MKFNIKNHVHFLPLAFFLTLDIVLLIAIRIYGLIPILKHSYIIDAGLAFSFVYIFSVEAKKKVEEGKPNTAMRLMFTCGGLFFSFIYSALKDIFQLFIN